MCKRKKVELVNELREKGFIFIFKNKFVDLVVGVNEENEGSEDIE